MKIHYSAPELSLIALISSEQLSDMEIDFDDMLGGSSGGVSANPEIDIDIPLN